MGLNSGFGCAGEKEATGIGLVFPSGPEGSFLVHCFPGCTITLVSSLPRVRLNIRTTLSLGFRFELLRKTLSK